MLRMIRAITLLPLYAFAERIAKILHYYYYYIITISFMQGIYTYIPETNNVPKEYNVPAILSLLFIITIIITGTYRLLSYGVMIH
jgi:hypothetical protein